MEHPEFQIYLWAAYLCPVSIYIEDLHDLSHILKTSCILNLSYIRHIWCWWPDMKNKYICPPPKTRRSTEEVRAAKEEGLGWTKPKAIDPEQDVDEDSVSALVQNYRSDAALSVWPPAQRGRRLCSPRRLGWFSTLGPLRGTRQEQVVYICFSFELHSFSV